MTERIALVVATVACCAAGLALGLVDGRVVGFETAFDEGILALATLAAGAVITRPDPRHAVGRILMWTGLAYASAQLLNQTASSTGSTELELVAWTPRMAWFSMLYFAIGRFPDGEWVGRWSRRLAWTSVVASVVPLVVWYRDGVVTSPTDGPTAPLVMGSFAAIVVCGAVIAVTVVSIHLRSDAIRRRQVGWVLLAIALAGTVNVVVVVVGSDGPLGVLQSFDSALIPGAIVLSITRYRLYEIDRIVSRTVTYGAATAAAFGIYSAMVVALERLLPVEGAMPVAVSTLAVAFSFMPLARRVQSWIDRRFFRTRYDAAGVVASFASELRATLDPSLAAARAETVVAETFQADAVSVWVAEESR